MTGDVRPRCPECGSTRWDVRCRCPIGDVHCASCGAWWHFRWTDDALLLYAGRGHE